MKLRRDEMHKYIEVKNSEYRQTIKETNDCGVVAISILCRTEYEKVHTMMKNRGRKHGKSSPWEAINDTIETLGFTKEEVKCRKPKKKGGGMYTQKTIGDKFKTGYYMCYTQSGNSAHVFALVNGVVQDWSNGREKRIRYVWKITKKRS